MECVKDKLEKHNYKLQDIKDGDDIIAYKKLIWNNIKQNQPSSLSK